MFEKEDRYVVIKRKDIDKYLGARDKTQLATVLEKINTCRSLDMRKPMACVVVESDWKCYDVVWGLVEREYNNAANR